MDTVIQNILFETIKITVFWGDLTGISAKTKKLR